MFFNELDKETFTCDVEVKRDLYYDQKASWGVFLCKKLDTGTELVIRGNFPYLEAKDCFSVEGELVEHKKFGLQLSVRSVIPIIPTHGKALERYLSSDKFPGIGKNTAAKIVKHFGSEIIKILDESPERLSEIKGLRENKRERLVRAWQEENRWRGDTLFLYKLGIYGQTAHKVMEVFPDNMQVILAQNPYLLMTHVKGFGFLKADRLALSLGVKKDSLERVKASFLYFLNEAQSQGHCFCYEDQLIHGCISLLGISEEKFMGLYMTAVGDLLLSKQLIIEDDVKGKRCLFLRLTHKAESELALRVMGLLSEAEEHKTEENSLERVKAWLEKYQSHLGLTLSEDQKKAIQEASRHPIFILTGGPGVGKTMTSRGILNLFLAMKKKVALASPTGRAAKRLEELTGYEAKTLHRLLEWSPKEHKFLRNETNPLDFDVLIVDEASMLDIFLAEKLFKALKLGSQLVLIGDRDQLPSVGPGYVLSHLIRSGRIQSITLKEIFRQAESSRIVAFSHQINEGVVPEFSSDSKSDCHFFPVTDEEDLVAQLNSFFSDFFPSLGFKARDIQILSPMNKGSLGCYALNQRIQKFLHKDIENKPTLNNFQYEFCEGDRVIQLSNDYDLGVFNGDIGYVTGIDVKEETLRVDFSTESVVFGKEQLNNLALAYAITIHKAQGSEFPVVMIPLVSAHTHMWSRNLIYTGLTRAKQLAVLLGTKKILNYSVKEQKTFKRRSLLQERLVRA